VEPAAGEGMHEKYPKTFVVDLTRCIFCGFCEAACPKQAIKLNRKYELAQYDKDVLYYDKEKLLSEE
jgi:NADH-quinone oxidoreductase subunit I